MDQSVGGFGEEPGVKVQLMNLVRSVRTVMRGVDTHTHTHDINMYDGPLCISTSSQQCGLPCLLFHCLDC